MPTVAAITIVYNEKFKLPRWVEYYSRQLGPRSCFVIDHGSDDGSTDDVLASQIIKIPRTPYDNQIRIEAISSLSHFLLKYFDYVIYADCDEIIVADPSRYAGLGDYCNKTRPDYVYSVGVDVLHNLELEKPLEIARLVTHQRSFAHFSAAMCKPNLVGFPVQWARGFHSHQKAPKFEGLFNFHLRYVDLDQGLQRQAITRGLSWAKPDEGGHHKTPDSQFEGLIRTWSHLPVVEDDPFSTDNGLLAGYITKFADEARKPEGCPSYNVDLFSFGRELIKIPRRFRGVF